MDATDKSAGPGQRVRLSLRWKAFGTLTVLLGVIHACFGAFEYHQSVQITRHDESVRLNGLLQAFDGVREQSAQDLGRIAAQVAASIGTAEMARRPGTHAQVAMELLAEVSGMRIYDVDGTPLGDMMSSPRGVQIPPAVESLLLGSARRTHRPSSTLWCGGDCLQVVYTPAFDRDGREVLVGLSQPVDSLLLAFARQTGADVALLSPSATPNGRLFGHHAYAVTNAPSLLPRLARVTGGRELPPEGRSAILSTAGQSFMTLAAQLPAARGRVLGLFVLDESPALERIGASLATSIAASLCGLLLSAAAIWWLLTPLSRRLQAITRALPMLAEQRFEDARHALRRKEREPRWPDELDLLTSSTEWLSGRLEQLRDAEAASAAKSRFLATMSHEVRTPLNGVLGLLEMLQHSNLDPGQRDSVRMVHESAQSLLRVLDDTLDLARIEAGRIELQREPFSVEDVLSGCVETVAAAARAKGLKLLVHLDSSLPEVVLGDAMRLRQVIGNLCSNAVKFTSSGRVVVSAQNRGRIGNSVHLRFSVYDSGPGIPLDVQRSLFQPFEQGHASTAARFGGTGLGLSICHGLVKRMGGRIGFVSKPEYGTEFSFWLEFPVPDGARKPQDRPLRGIEVDVDIVQVDERAPMAENLRILGATLRSGASLRIHEPDPLHLAVEGGSGGPCLLAYPVHRRALLRALARAAGLDSPEADGDPAHPAPPGLRILAVDDHPTNLEVIARQLRLLGHDCVTAPEGATALRLACGEHFDLLLTDLRMPEMDGLQLVRELRRREASGELPGRLPALALSAHTSAGEAELCRAAGMDACLSKPIDLEGLRQALLPWTRESARPPLPPSPEADFLVLDRRRLVALLGGDENAAESVQRAFVRINRAMIAGLASLAGIGDKAALGAAAHRLLGSARTVCAPRLERALAALEGAAHRGDIPDCGRLAAAAAAEFEAVAAQVSTAD